MPFQTPILFLIFNRPENTAQVFEAIRRLKPAKLYVAADGPQHSNRLDAESVARARAVLNRVDWDCAVHTLYREQNLGCKSAVSSAIDWFFKHEEAGIILEDDCLPNHSFFLFCEEMLQQYRHDERVMMVTGDNFQFGQRPSKYSYYFSNYANIWGWATWRRAWALYDVNMLLWPEIREGGWHTMFAENKEMAALWEWIFQDVYEGKVDTWDYQWNFACKVNNGLSVVPAANLVSNIGFVGASTNTDAAINNLGNLERQELAFPLTHPPFVIPDKVADEHLVKLHYRHLKYHKYRKALKNALPAELLKLVRSFKKP